MKIQVLLFISLVCLLCTYSYGVILTNSGCELDNDGGMNEVKFSDDFTLYHDVLDSHIHVTLEVETKGWVGFGISEPLSGSMKG